MFMTKAKSTMQGDEHLSVLADTQMDRHRETLAGSAFHDFLHFMTYCFTVKLKTRI